MKAKFLRPKPDEPMVREGEGGRRKGEEGGRRRRGGGLLEHLNIVVPIRPEYQSSSLQSDEVFFMPAVLKHATEEELHMEQSLTDPVPLMIHFKCGFVPVGVFCAMIASLVAQDDMLGWILSEPSLVPRPLFNTARGKGGLVNIVLALYPGHFSLPDYVA